MLAQLSDPHVHDDASAEALAAAVRSVLALSRLPDAVLVSGDLAEHGAEEEYTRVRELLAPLPMPVRVLPGNHDDPEALRAQLDASEVTDVDGLRLIACDTTQPGRDDGRLDVERLAARLAESNSPTIVAMHHPPVEIGIPAMDDIGLPEADRAALAELLARSPHVRRVIAGHVHRGAFATLGGCGVVTCPSTHLQAKLEIGATEFTIVNEPPAFAVHTATVSHIQPVTR
jgi:3',5'-cyclic-AMP phosphodiesterase